MNIILGVYDDDVFLYVKCIC